MYKFNIGERVFVVDRQISSEPIEETVEEIRVREGELYYNGRQEKKIFKSKKEAYMNLKSILEEEQAKSIKQWQSLIDEVAQKIESC